MIDTLLPTPAAPPRTDRDLLRDFVTRNDQAAFSALVRRHGPAVLGVCRRVLHNRHDAEDAFQATFLVLAQKAHAIHKGDSLASWLHGVSFRIALRARRDDARRRKHESRAAPAPAPASPDLAWRELQAILDEEVQSLPDHQRSAFVLCCLGGLSKAEAARQLDVKEGTVSSRLAAARSRLRRRLAARGVRLSAVLTALSLCPKRAPAVPPTLARRAAELAGPGAGNASARAFTLAQGAMRTMFAARFKPVAALLLVLGLLGAGVGTLHHLQAGAQRLDPPPTKEPPAPAKAAEDKGALRMTGRVLDPEGRPVADARIYWPHLRKPKPTRLDDVAIVERAVTGKDGRFSVALPRADIQPAMRFKLVAVAEGFGMAWADLPGEGAGPLTFRLVRDRPIRGRVIDTEGRPIAGVEVLVNSVHSSPDGKLDGFLTAWKAEWQMALRQLPDVVYLPPVGKGRAIKTDRDGKFTLAGVGENRVAELHLRGPGMASTSLHVVSRARFDPASINKATREKRLAGVGFLMEVPLLYGPTISHVADPERPIEGTVRDAATGKPIAGVRVWCGAGRGDNAQSVTDTKGHYRLRGLPKEREYLVYAESPEGSDYLRTGARAADAPGYEPMTVDLTMARGVVVTGRILDKATGKGVEGGIRFAPLPDNPFFGKPGYDSYKTERLMHSTDKDGRFRIVVLPGPGVLMVQAHGMIEEDGVRVKPYKLPRVSKADAKRLHLVDTDRRRTYFPTAGGSTESLSIQNALKVLDLKVGKGPVKADLVVDPGLSATVHVRGPDGKPLSGAVASGLSESWPFTFPLRSASCTVRALDPDRPREVVFYHPKKKLGGTLTLRGDEKEPPPVKLQPAGAVTGRLLDADGLPVAGAEVRISAPDEVASELYRHLRLSREPIRTDKDGRFHADVVPGVSFYLGLRKGKQSLTAEPRIGTRKADAGKTLDLGDIRTRPRG
jgi:RNA polymerase sigma factor (sigma-70 family)